MDAGRKKELLAHYDKLKELNKEQPSGGGDKGASKRKGPRVSFPEPYSRDPNALFVQQTPTGQMKLYPAPMNNNAAGHVFSQPVKYTNIRLARQVGPHDKDKSFEVATVDYKSGLLRLYQTEIDFLSNEPAFSEIVRVESKKRYNNQIYVSEVLKFLKRGHSLLHPNCRCVFTEAEYSSARASELGISLARQRPGMPEDRTSLRDGKCTLETARCARTSWELAQEIAVGDLYEIRDKSGKSLVEVLRSSTQIVVEDDQAKGELWAFKATYEASSKQEVLQLVRAHPLGFNEPKEHDTYNGVQADVNTLVADGDVYRITNPETKHSILFPRRKDLEIEVDSDIKKLWKDCGAKSKETPETVRKALEAHGLIPTKQEKAETKVLGKRKASGTRRRAKSKPDGHDFLRKSLGSGQGAR